MHTTRRSWMAATALSAISYSRVLGANERIRIGLIGAGSRGTYVTGLFKETGQCDVVALCDVYTPNLERARAQLNPDAKSFLDFHDLLAEKDIQAVVIGSPDHWHVPMTVDAMKAGKDVYVEKPLTHNLAEGRQLAEFVKTRKELVQVGYQQRNTPTFERVKELVAGGKLGDITLVQASWHSGQLGATKGLDKFDFKADNIDWKRWLGPAPARPIDKARFRVWRYFWDYGGGSVTDLMSHWVDAIHWITDDDTPSHLSAFGDNLATPELECPDTVIANMAYPKRHLLAFRNTVYGGKDSYGIAIHGSKGWVQFNRQNLVLWYSGEGNRNVPALQMNDIDGTPYHVLDFLDCIRARRQPRSDVQSAVKSAEVGHRTNDAIRGKKMSTA
ncbi:MAG: Gfo/Idh/MocA family oxidoreductase [Bryobacterales bacterium]|nr:Gfo/Idh/MocA family oxidoreductase [Bryobacterales bacterium]